MSDTKKYQNNQEIVNTFIVVVWEKEVVNTIIKKSATWEILKYV